MPAAGTRKTPRRRRPSVDLATRVLYRSLQTDRRRVAHTLHRDVAQDLAAAQLQLALIDTMPARARPAALGRVSELLGRSSAAAQALELSLGPPLLAQMGLGPPLKWLAHRHRGRGKLDLMVAADLPRFAPDVEAEIYDALATFFERAVSPRRPRSMTIAMRGRTAVFAASGRMMTAAPEALAEIRARIASVTGQVKLIIEARVDGGVGLELRVPPAIGPPRRRQTL